MIFGLHRIKGNKQQVFKEATSKREEIAAIFRERLGPDLESFQFYRYQKSVSPGIQEFVSTNDSFALINSTD